MLNRQEKRVSHPGPEPVFSSLLQIPCTCCNIFSGYFRLPEKSDIFAHGPGTRFLKPAAYPLRPLQFIFRTFPDA